MKIYKLWGWYSWGYMNWSQILWDISMRKVQDTLSFWLAHLNLSLKLLHSGSFAALIGYWTLKHANKLVHEQLLKGSIESLLSCWHIASVLRVFCGFFQGDRARLFQNDFTLGHMSDPFLDTCTISSVFGNWFFILEGKMDINILI